MKSYTDSLKTYYGNELVPVDFAKNGDKIKSDINNWIENTTNQKIKDLIPQDVSLKTAVLVLVNAIYFKGDWSLKFKENITSKQTFYSSKDKDLLVDMMIQNNEEFYYKESDDVQVLGLPYLNDELALYIVLPLQRYGLQQLESILTADKLIDLIQSSTKRKLAEVCIY